VPERRRKKTNKLRGNRSHGKGNTKNRRGAGCRGGRGKAGSHKHTYSKYWMEFGIKKRLKAKEREEAINLNELNGLIPLLLEKKQAVKEGEKIIIEGKNAGFSKVLGRGKIDFAIELKGIKASKKARKEIEEKGGKIE